MLDFESDFSRGKNLFFKLGKLLGSWLALLVFVSFFYLILTRLQPVLQTYLVLIAAATLCYLVFMVIKSLVRKKENHGIHV